jgi:hypothetical protein
MCEAAYFADILQDIHNQLQISNVKCRKGQPDMAKMPVAVLESFTAGFADAGLARGALIDSSISQREHQHTKTR